MTTQHQTLPPDAATPAASGARGLPPYPYGLTHRELRAEIRRCAAHGWQLWEIRHRFPSTVPERRK